MIGRRSANTAFTSPVNSAGVNLTGKPTSSRSPAERHFSASSGEHRVEHERCLSVFVALQASVEPKAARCAALPTGAQHGDEKRETKRRTRGAPVSRQRAPKMNRRRTFSGEQKVIGDKRSVTPGPSSSESPRCDFLCLRRLANINVFRSFRQGPASGSLAAAPCSLHRAPKDAAVCAPFQARTKSASDRNYEISPQHSSVPSPRLLATRSRLNE